MLVIREGIFWQVINKIKNPATVDLVVDVETTGLNCWTGDVLCGIGICFPDMETFYFPFRHQIDYREVCPTMPLLFSLVPPNNNLDISLLPSLFNAIREVPKLIGHNVKFDLAIMYQDGYIMPEEQLLEDTLAMARPCLAGKDARMNLDALTAWLIGSEAAAYKKQFQHYLKKNGWQNNYDRAPADICGQYCEDDVKSTRLIYQELSKIIVQTGQEKIRAQEAEVIRTIWNMEQRGLYYDREYRDKCIPKVKARVDMLISNINGFIVEHREKELGRELTTFEKQRLAFNPASNKELDRAMGILGLRSSNIGKSGLGKWDVAELMGLSHPIGGTIIELRGLQKVLTTYLESLYKWDKTGIIHCNFKPWGTSTGRMSSEEPNLQNLTRGVQNLMGSEMSEEVLEAFKAMLGAYQGQSVDIPKTEGAVSSLTTGTVKGLTEKFDDTDDMTIAVRRLYIPRPGYKLWFIDYEQMEMRVFADYVNDAELSRLLETSGFDFHSYVASSVWKVDEQSELWKFYRTLAKAVNFGLIFGIGDAKLAAQIQKSQDEAKQYKFEYFNRFPNSFKFLKDVANKIRTVGYVTNRFGRRYELPPERDYVGVNYLVQGSSADIVKNRMVACDKFLLKEKVKSRLISQVHDELIFELAEDEMYQLAPELQKIIEHRLIKTFLPAEVSIGIPSMAQKKAVCMSCLQVKEKDHSCGGVK